MGEANIGCALSSKHKPTLGSTSIGAESSERLLLLDIESPHQTQLQPCLFSEPSFWQLQHYNTCTPPCSGARFTPSSAQVQPLRSRQVLESVYE